MSKTDQRPISYCCVRWVRDFREDGGGGIINNLLRTGVPNRLVYQNDQLLRPPTKMISNILLLTLFSLTSAKSVVTVSIVCVWLCQFPTLFVVLPFLLLLSVAFFSIIFIWCSCCYSFYLMRAWKQVSLSLSLSAPQNVIGKCEMLRLVIIMPIHVMQSVKFFTWTTSSCITI